MFNIFDISLNVAPFCFFLGKILTDITVPADKNANVNTGATLKPGGPVKPGTKPGINKDEDAPLMDNEYRLGTSTPTNKSPSTDQNMAAKVAASLNKEIESTAVTPVNAKKLPSVNGTAPTANGTATKEVRITVKIF